ncbi:hypothetical protein A3F07_04405 [candidate division WWE3 bacterium RIFCSPHIGHO2_12_FULL_38_15]|uniref:Uncharacterized protein n=1 Tax=candidate division WWE3 bacterium RIFCSPHIGHO2_02_FULL_38_14 TaxID=1802620 RepID=A0A1F4V6W7_UNCKA|nr:MAG: hypothetical protein A3F07_04405 [candidate division WWE3 bacterium RIFCSPHIGHO2_12_FULL_38_15]OGC52891.1 MAG: hypothetical protein A3D91_03415 [candidate division WWE3 bacterium RIFCSPHIGHO2_02_FULL_38_14]HLB51345.1 hypothetical protein [Patescibacteria group bacterium]
MKTRLSLVLLVSALALIVVFGTLPTLPALAATSTQVSPKYDASASVLTTQTPLTSTPFLPFIFPEDGGLRIVSPITPTVDGVPVTSTLDSGDYFYPAGAGQYTVDVGIWPYSPVALDYAKLDPGKIYSDDAVMIQAGTFTVTLARYLNNPRADGRVYSIKGWAYGYQDGWQFGLRTSLWNSVSRTWGSGTWEQYTTVKLSGEPVCDKGMYGFVASQISVGLCGVQEVSIEGQNSPIRDDDTLRFDAVVGTSSVISGTSVVLTNADGTRIAGKVLVASSGFTITEEGLSLGNSQWPIWVAAYENRIFNVSGAAYNVGYDWQTFRLEGRCGTIWCQTVPWGYFTTLRLRQIKWTVFLPTVIH